MEQDKASLNAILSSNFSIEQFITIYSRIDEQIAQLHQCSSDDFLGLNSDFQQFFKQSKLISNNATTILNELTKAESADLLREIEVFYKELQRIQFGFASLLDKSKEELLLLLDSVDNIFFPIKNLNQDLLTLEILLANLKIFIFSKPVFRENYEKDLKSFAEVLERFKTMNNENQQLLRKLKEYGKETVSTFERIKSSSVKDLNIILNNLHLGIILFAEKHEEVARLIPKLKLQTENTSKSIGSIITNLQYHDIIRQKMEHVHETHKKLLQELADTSRSSDQDIKSNESLLLKIRDIANLQSAQLVYANKEYQKAIEIITNKFVEIGNDMTTIASMCNEMYLSQDNSPEIHIQDFVHKMKNSATVFHSFLEDTSEFTKRTSMLGSMVNELSTSLANLSPVLKSLKEVLSGTCEKFSTVGQKDGKLLESLNQIKELYKDVKGFEELIKEVFAHVEVSVKKINQRNEGELAKTSDEGEYSEAANSMSRIIEQLNSKNESILSLLGGSIDISKTILGDIDLSVGKIRYYDFFEKVIGAIIEEFNQIHQLLKSEVNFETSETFEEIRSSYTMASEHIIHDTVVGDTSADGDVDLFSDDEEDDDNLELF